MAECMKCGKTLTADEIALHRKLFNRGAKRFLCIRCCSEHFDVPVPLLEQKIKYFRETGCTLFQS